MIENCVFKMLRRCGKLWFYFICFSATDPIKFVTLTGIFSMERLNLQQVDFILPNHLCLMCPAPLPIQLNHKNRILEYYLTDFFSNVMLSCSCSCIIHNLTMPPTSSSLTHKATWLSTIETDSVAFIATQTASISR